MEAKSGQRSSYVLDLEVNINISPHFLTRIKQAQTLIVVISINFANFLLYSSEKFYTLILFTPVDCGGFMSSQPIFATVISRVQVKIGPLIMMS